MTELGQRPGDGDLVAALWMPHGGEVEGGHKVQLAKTASALRSLGVTAVECYDKALPDHRIDIVHGFGLRSNDVVRCRDAGLPVVISPIYWGLGYSMGSRRGAVGWPRLRSALGKARRAGRLGSASVHGRQTLVRVTFGDLADEIDRLVAYSVADLLLTNAEGEKANLQAELGVPTEIRVVPNSIDPDLFSPGFNTPRPAGSVLCVGRIEPHKNQLGVIEAVSGLPGATLTVVGAPHPDHPRYLERCRAAAGPNVTILGKVPHEELPHLYGSHHTHALASWYETTGLVSLEAAAAGCTVVSTSRGHAREYLQGDAWYCDPASPASVRDALRSALRHKASPDLARRINNRYTWGETARLTLRAYEDVLRRRRPR